MLFIMTILAIPVYGICIWSLYEPEESYFFMKKWQYKELPELSDVQIKLIRIGSVAVMIIMTVQLIMMAIETFTGH
jgi:hypothetical protein